MSVSSLGNVDALNERQFPIHGFATNDTSYGIHRYSLDCARQFCESLIHDALGRPLSIVILGRSFIGAEDLDSGESANVIRTADGRVLIHVDGTDLSEASICISIASKSTV